MRKYTHRELLERQSEKTSLPRSPVAVVANNIRSLYNVGSIFRTADGAGVEKLWLCGITGIPPSLRISKTALGAETHVPWEYAEDIAQVLQGYHTRGYEVVLLEQTEKSIPYQEYRPQGPVCLVIGNEVDGVEADLLALCDLAIEVEMAGLKISLNVAVAMGIAVFHIRNRLQTYLMQ
ncbi:MAG: RNA methyltransferase [Candidatus Omnitrophota bacterium]